MSSITAAATYNNKGGLMDTNLSADVNYGQKIVVGPETTPMGDQNANEQTEGDPALVTRETSGQTQEELYDENGNPIPHSTNAGVLGAQTYTDENGNTYTSTPNVDGTINKTITDADGNVVFSETSSATEEKMGELGSQYADLLNEKNNRDSFWDNLWGSVTDFGESMVNFVSGDGFNTDLEVVQNDITKLQQQMWKSGDMDRLAWENIYQPKENSYVTNIQNSYKDSRGNYKKAWETNSNENNIKHYTYNGDDSSDPDAMAERYRYYELLLEQKYGASLDEKLTEQFLNNQGAVIIAEQGKGSGAIYIPETGKQYNDRITKIWMDEDGALNIQEFNRSNIDPDNQANPIASGEYGYIGRPDNKGAYLVNNEKVDQLPSTLRGEILNSQLNETDYGKLIQTGTAMEQLRYFDSEQNGYWNNGQRWINIHFATGGPWSEGCLTIYNATDPRAGENGNMHELSHQDLANRPGNDFSTFSYNIPKGKYGYIFIDQSGF